MGWGSGGYEEVSACWVYGGGAWECCAWGVVLWWREGGSGGVWMWMREMACVYPQRNAACTGSHDTNKPSIKNPRTPNIIILRNPHSIDKTDTSIPNQPTHSIDRSIESSYSIFLAAAAKINCIHTSSSTTELHTSSSTTERPTGSKSGQMPALENTGSLSMA